MQIYAELSKKYSKKIDDGLADFNLPDGVTLSQRHRGRFCYMDCDGEISRGLLVAFLESRGIPWQDNDVVQAIDRNDRKDGKDKR